MPDELPTASTGNSTAVVAVVISCVALLVAAVALGYALRTPRSAAPSAATAPKVAASTVGVAEQEYSIAALPAAVPAGPAAFHVINNGNAAHEFVLIKTDTADGALPRAPDGRVDMTSLAVVAQAQNIVAGASADVTAAVTPGHYVLICNITGHYAAGMHTGFEVT